MQYRELTEIGLLDEIDTKSSEKNGGVVIFKHSTRCAISHMVWSRFKRSWNWPESELPLYMLDLIRFREVSNEIARRYNVQHESPQLLLIKNARCIYNTSHNDIHPSNLEGIVND